MEKKIKIWTKVFCSILPGEISFVFKMFLKQRHFEDVRVLAFYFFYH